MGLVLPSSGQWDIPPDCPMHEFLESTGAVRWVEFENRFRKEWVKDDNQSVLLFSDGEIW